MQWLRMKPAETVDLNEILKHGLMPEPTALAETDGTLRSGPKSLLVDGMTSGTACPPNTKPNQIKSDQTKDLIMSGLRAKHEEVDTRLILHCLQAETENIVVSVRNTDVFVLLVAHFQLFIFMDESRQRKKQKYIPVHTVCKKNIVWSDGCTGVASFPLQSAATSSFV